MIQSSDFCVFIISHGRADRVETYDTLRRGGYTGKICVVIDNEDAQYERYKERFDDVLCFTKQALIDVTDTVGLRRRASATYARNYVEIYARVNKIVSYAIMDDDIVALRYKWLEGDTVRSLQVTGGLDEVFRAYSEFIVNNNIATTSFGTVMFYVGGAGNLGKRITDLRETYQIHIRNTKFDVDWISIINEDIITEILTAQQGYIWWSLPFIVYDAVAMNDKSGGVKDAYDTITPFERAFLATIVHPDCCKPGYSHGKMRIIQNRKASYPMIISSRYKK